MIRIIESPVGAFLATTVVVLALLGCVAVGIGAVIRPRRFMNAYMKRCGEMLSDWNELGVQLFGLLFACGSGWMLYKLLRLFYRH